jgi:hypothetical protein
LVIAVASLDQTDEVVKYDYYVSSARRRPCVACTWSAWAWMVAE